MTSANPRMAECDRKAARHTWVYRASQVVFVVIVAFVLSVVFTA